MGEQRQPTNSPGVFLFMALSQTDRISICVFFAVVNLNSLGGSHALVVATVWTGFAHLLFAVLGTFILKRFPTSFAIGFLLGLVLVLANQNLVLGGTFYRYRHGVPATNQAFGSICYVSFIVLAFFGGLLFQFKKHLVVAPIDAKGFRRNTAPSESNQEASPYRSYDNDDTSDA
jgi:hypothetical protein